MNVKPICHWNCVEYWKPSNQLFLIVLPFIHTEQKGQKWKKKKKCFKCITKHREIEYATI